MSGPEPSRTESSATEVFRAQPDDASFETDFSALAARFAEKSGGGLSAELSADLALEVVLNEIVEQACLATGATGAAIVLERDGEMVCRASSGPTAPALGMRLDAASGLTGECMKTHQTQRCEDVLADERADVEASVRLGVRSVMVMPLLRGTEPGGELLGVFELFSSRPAAFGERDEGTLEVLAGRTLSNLERAARSLEAPVVAAEPIAESAAEIEIEPEIATDVMPRRFDFVNWALGAAVLACVMLLGVLVGRHFGAGKRVVRVRAAAPAAALSHASTPASSASNQSAGAAASPSPAPKAGGIAAAPPGGLLVYENGKEVFRMGPDGKRSGGGMQPAASVEPEKTAPDKVVQLSPAAAEDSVLHRVEPEYPELARQLKLQGAVVLDVHIAASGVVQDVQVVSGVPVLAQASTKAVKQWRFKPRAVEMETRVTLNFRLPG
jgi:TonB family protein